MLPRDDQTYLLELLSIGETDISAQCQQVDKQEHNRFDCHMKEGVDIESWHSSTMSAKPQHEFETCDQFHDQHFHFVLAMRL